MCAQINRDTPALIVDHIIPHKDDPRLFWDRSNLQALCATCHGVKRRQDHGNLMPGCDVDGVPMDPGHWWRKGD